MSEKAEAVPAEDVVADAPRSRREPGKDPRGCRGRAKGGNGKSGRRPRPRPRLLPRPNTRQLQLQSRQALQRRPLIPLRGRARRYSDATWASLSSSCTRRTGSQDRSSLQSSRESLTRKAEIPIDNTPRYVPQHVLSPEFGGLSNYERGVDSFLNEAKKDLQILKNDPDATPKQIRDVKDKIIYLRSLHENYFIGMNVFRTAKGGRDRIQ